MRRNLIAASATLAVLAASLSACASAPKTGASTAGCVNPSAPHRVEIVVEHGNSKTTSRCVGFEGSGISALAAIKASGIGHQSEKTSFGTALCAIDGEPSRFSSCFPSGAPYWAMFVAPRGGAWAAPTVGVQGVTLHAGDSLGWRYDPAAQNPPAAPAAAPGVPR